MHNYAVMPTAELADLAESLYRKADFAPELRPNGTIVLIELRNVVPALVERLRRLDTASPQFSAIPK